MKPRTLFPNSIDAERKLELRRQRARDWNKNNAEKFKARTKAYHVALKECVIREYGGKCECCQESNIAFLTIDHINNDGQQDRKKTGSGWRFYFHLKKNGFPKGKYRVLCMNCNWGRRYTGICPHKVDTALRAVV